MQNFYAILINNGLSSKGSYHYGQRKCAIIRSSVVDPVSRSNTGETNKKSSEAALILVRHGESLWNEKNLFTGCVDVPLSKNGIDEAIEAGKRISSIPIDFIFTSALIRAQMTAMLAMTQHRSKKVPIVMHNESEQARSWSQTQPIVTVRSASESAFNLIESKEGRFCCGTDDRVFASVQKEVARIENRTQPTYALWEKNHV
ncbi:hypothetical protein Lal_00004333 [Lupinus albus]|nr:hypothetical protein Lal_00004333 [Lupinus albus]